MTRWYVKELSQLTQISIQTLYHYDRIDLLKPSLRLENDYRVYSEQDLSRLQQIIALKYFGFELAQIKKMLSSELNVREHFAAQSKLLEQKAESLFAASQKLKQITAATECDKSIPWQSIIESIEVFRMTDQIEHSWVGKVLSADELSQYVKFAKGLETRFTAEEKEKNKTIWAGLLKEINSSLHLDPASESARVLAEKIMTWVKKLYGKEFSSLRLTVWEKGFKGGHAAADRGLTADAVRWIDQAVQAFYRHKALSILKHAERIEQHELSRRWNELLEERYGDCVTPKKKFTSAMSQDPEISITAREFLMAAQ